MRVPRLYCPQLVEGGNVLSADESHHAVAVLRLRRGDRVILFDGAGREGEATVSNATDRRVEAAVQALTTRAFETLHRITLAVAMAKTHRQAYTIEKCTELGVAAFWPIRAGRSVTEPGAAAAPKWSRRAIEAAKQSGRAWVPTVAEPQDLGRAVKRMSEFTASALADPEGNETWPTFLSHQPTGATLLVFIGPEGGFTSMERDQLIAAGAQPVRLSPTILRTETAAVALCAAEAAISAHP